MTLAEFLIDPDALVGKQVSVTGWLHSDSVRLWLGDRPRCENRPLVVRAPEIPQWFQWYIPPVVGAGWAQCFEAEVRGVVLPRNWEGLPVLGGEVNAVVRYSGVLFLRGGVPAEPDAAPDGPSKPRPPVSL